MQERRLSNRVQVAPKILICEDDPMLAELLDIRLKQIGCVVNITNCCGSCLVEIKKEFYKIVLLDNVLPDGKGVNIISEILAISPNTKVIIMTGYGINEDKLYALNFGAGFIEKPFDTLKIVAKLRAVLAE